MPRSTPSRSRRTTRSTCVASTGNPILSMRALCRGRVCLRTARPGKAHRTAAPCVRGLVCALSPDASPRPGAHPRTGWRLPALPLCKRQRNMKKCCKILTHTKCTGNKKTLCNGRTVCIAFSFYVKFSVRRMRSRHRKGRSWALGGYPSTSVSAGRKNAKIADMYRFALLAGLLEPYGYSHIIAISIQKCVQRQPIIKNGTKSAVC